MTDTPCFLAETERWLVLAKPAGWLSVRPSPASGAGRGQGPGAARDPGPSAEGEPEAGIAEKDDTRPILSDWLRGERPGEIYVVHRLDVETSGVILFARTRDSHREANQWFQTHRARKTYHALASGAPSLPMIRASVPVAGQTATTVIEVKERFGGGVGFLAVVTPRTGRRHQIRIHCARSGHPIFGDSRYGGTRIISFSQGGFSSELLSRESPSRESPSSGPGPRAALEIPRVALHAYRLELPSGESFQADWPADFAGWVQVLRGAAAP